MIQKNIKTFMVLISILGVIFSSFMSMGISFNVGRKVVYAYIGGSSVRGVSTSKTAVWRYDGKLFKGRVYTLPYGTFYDMYFSEPLENGSLAEHLQVLIGYSSVDYVLRIYRFSEKKNMYVPIKMLSKGEQYVNRAMSNVSERGIGKWYAASNKHIVPFDRGYLIANVNDLPSAYGVHDTDINGPIKFGSIVSPNITLSTFDGKQKISYYAVGMVKLHPLTNHLSSGGRLRRIGFGLYVSSKPIREVFQKYASVVGGRVITTPLLYIFGDVMFSVEPYVGSVHNIAWSNFFTHFNSNNPVAYSDNVNLGSIPYILGVASMVSGNALIGLLTYGVQLIPASYDIAKWYSTTDGVKVDIYHMMFLPNDEMDKRYTALNVFPPGRFLPVYTSYIDNPDSHNVANVKGTLWITASGIVQIGDSSRNRRYISVSTPIPVSLRFRVIDNDLHTLDRKA